MSDAELPDGGGVGRNYENGDDPTSLELAYQYHDILATPRRAVIIDVLADERITDLHSLSSQVAEHEVGPDYDSQDRKRVYVGLYQCHLPRLDTADVVEYDDDTGVVTRGPEYESVRRFQRRARGDHRGIVGRALAWVREVVPDV